jgi:hypothetical protein
MARSRREEEGGGGIGAARSWRWRPAAGRLEEEAVSPATDVAAANRKVQARRRRRRIFPAGFILPKNMEEGEDRTVVDAGHSFSPPRQGRVSRCEDGR